MFTTFEAVESNVRVYCRKFPTLFARAKGSEIWNAAGDSFIDLFTGAGTLNYGHNPPALKMAARDYIDADGILHGLDMYTVAKATLLERFTEIILKPRGMNYRLMFPGPTGTNAIEAAMKLARKVTGRTNIAAFTNGFHGMTLGALSATGSQFKRRGAGLVMGGVDRFPYDGFFGSELDTLPLIRRLLDEPSSGFDPPAAFLLETVQGEGGLNTASQEWLRGLAALAKQCGSLLIIDDIQAGCGRTGSFFSFETAGLEPDIVCLSKSLSGFGTPFALVLVKPAIDVWSPGEHNGTFRGNNLAFVTATAALEAYWRSDQLMAHAAEAARTLGDWMERSAAEFNLGPRAVRGRGLMRGLVMPTEDAAEAITKAAFQAGVVIETSGGNNEVIKFLPALNMPLDMLEEALVRLTQCLAYAHR